MKTHMRNPSRPNTTACKATSAYPMEFAKIWKKVTCVRCLAKIPKFVELRMKEYKNERA